MIIDTRTRDMRLFHKLVRNNRKKGHNLIDDLCVNGETYSEILDFWSPYLGFAEYLAFTIVLFVAASFMNVHIFSVKCSVSFNVLVVLLKASIDWSPEGKMGKG
jgi:hypothetical protein